MFTTIFENVSRAFQNRLICLIYLNIDGDIAFQAFAELLPHSSTSKIFGFEEDHLSQDPQTLEGNFQVLIFKKLGDLKDYKVSDLSYKALLSDSFRIGKSLSISIFLLFLFQSQALYLPVTSVLTIIFSPQQESSKTITYWSAHPNFSTVLQVVLAISYLEQQQQQVNLKPITQLSLKFHISRTTYWILVIQILFLTSFQALLIGVFRFFILRSVQNLFDVERSLILVGSLSLASTWKQDFKLNLIGILGHLHTFCVLTIQEAITLQIWQQSR